MAGIYKIGFPADTPRDEAEAAAREQVRQLDQDDVLEIGIVQTDEHQAAGEYLVRIVTGQPEPETPAEPEPDGPAVTQLAAERQQLLARLAELDAHMAAGS
ncbi:hypothetical protein ACWEQG_01930 [Microbispora sp. NPDC004025]